MIPYTGWKYQQRNSDTSNGAMTAREPAIPIESSDNTAFALGMEMASAAVRLHKLWLGNSLGSEVLGMLTVS